MILRRAVEELSGAQPLETGVLPTLLGQYADMLATQGSLSSAVTYLVDPNEVCLVESFGLFTRTVKITRSYVILEVCDVNNLDFVDQI